MAVNVNRSNGPYDFYITCLNNPEWEERILKNLEGRGLRGYHKGKFRLGGMKLTSRYNAVKNHEVKIIGFVKQSLKKSEMDTYIAYLALEIGKERDLVICVQTSSDAVIPKELSGLVTYEGWNEDMEDDLCSRIYESIESVKHGGSVDISNTERQNQQHGYDEPDIGAEPNNSTREDTQADGAGDADDAQADGAGDAGRVQNQQANTHNGRVQNKKIANGHNGMMWLIGCAIAIISMIARIVLEQVEEFQSLSNEQKVAFTFSSVVIVLVIIFGGLWYFGAIQPYFQPLSIGQKTFGVFATVTIVLTINFALYYFPTIRAYFESLYYEEKVSFGLFTFAIVLIISGLFYNFMYFGEFSKGEKVAFVFVTVIVVCIIFYILYHFAAILSELVSLSNEQKAGVVFFVIALVLLMFRVFSITSVPLLKFFYDQVLKLL